MRNKQSIAGDPKKVDLPSQNSNYCVYYGHIFLAKFFSDHKFQCYSMLIKLFIYIF